MRVRSLDRSHSMSKGVKNNAAAGLALHDRYRALLPKTPVRRCNHPLCARYLSTVATLFVFAVVVSVFLKSRGGRWGEHIQLNNWKRAQNGKFRLPARNLRPVNSCIIWLMFLYMDELVRTYVLHFGVKASINKFKI